MKKIILSSLILGISVFGFELDCKSKLAIEMLKDHMPYIYSLNSSYLKPWQTFTQDEYLKGNIELISEEISNNYTKSKKCVFKITTKNNKEVKNRLTYYFDDKEINIDGAIIENGVSLRTKKKYF